MRGNSPLSFVAVGAALGVAFPLLFRLLYAGPAAGPNLPVVGWTALDYLQLMLWPMPLLIAAPGDPGAPDLSEWGPFTVAALANAALYGVLGALLWAGLARSRFILVVPVLVLAGLWYAVWTA